MLWEYIKNRFEEIGARLEVIEPDKHSRIRTRGDFSADVQEDARGEYFELIVQRADNPQVVHVDPKTRHLVFHVNAEKFLMGHDERHWFVAAVPAGVTTVREAMEALKPAAVRVAERKARVRKKNRNRRKNEAFVRQGEWFFLPAPDFDPGTAPLFRNEPLQRNARSKPHVVEELARTGGRTVMVCSRHRSGVSMAEYERILQKNPAARRWNWFPRTANPVVHVRGRVRHPDHKTLELRGWHRVVLNGEATSQSVAFLD